MENGNGSTTKTVRGDNGHKMDPDRVHRLFEDGYREIEILKDGTIRERGGDGNDEAVTRSLKTDRTWY